MDIGNRFSLEDFLAYFFPGVIAASGVYALLLLTPLKSSLALLSADITTGIIFLVLSYIAGILLSGFSEIAFRFYDTRRKAQSQKDAIPLQDDLRRAIIEAYKDIFKISKGVKFEWSKDRFYVCRSLVFETMPSVLPPIQRQSSLRQLRMNLLPSLLIWFGAGLGWGIRELLSNDFLWGITLMVVSAVLFFAVTATTVNRMRSNDWREVREVLTAFLAGYETGAFENKEKKKS
ncbi:MAG TPA: hypothetical protein VLE49_13535 [Anaerolineales bacterium]|nr:hypothetical protein [Anaerolineales bacterium]